MIGTTSDTIAACLLIVGSIISVSDRCSLGRLDIDKGDRIAIPGITFVVHLAQIVDAQPVPVDGIILASFAMLIA